MAYWINQLESGSLTQAKMLIDFTNIQENVANTDLFVGPVSGGAGVPGSVQPELFPGPGLPIRPSSTAGSGFR